MQTLTGKYRIFSGLRTTWPWLLVLSALLYACQETGNAEKKLPSYDEQARNAVLLPLDSFTNTPLIQQRVAEIRQALTLPIPVLIRVLPVILKIRLRAKLTGMKYLAYTLPGKVIWLP